MARKPSIQVGDYVGDKHVKVVAIDRTNRKNPMGTFECINDGKHFEAPLYKVKSGQHSGLCPECSKERQVIYKDNSYIGDHGMFLLHHCENDATRGLFRCSCGRECERDIQDVVNNRSKCCNECLRKHRSEEHTGKPMPVKWKIGDFLGDAKIELIAFDHYEIGKGWFGQFRCPICKKLFVARISQISNNRIKGCGQKHSADFNSSII